jgi:hypothetical protein
MPDKRVLFSKPYFVLLVTGKKKKNGAATVAANQTSRPAMQYKTNGCAATISEIDTVSKQRPKHIKKGRSRSRAHFLF